MPGGRPTDYNHQVADAICERLCDGESLRSICQDEDMPTRSTVLRWVGLHEEFSAQYAEARKVQADSLFDDILTIADDGRNDWMKKNDPENEGYVFNGEHYQRARLRLDARKWMAGKLRPKQYGEKQSVDHTNSDGSLGAFLAAVATGTGRVGGSDKSS